MNVPFQFLPLETQIQVIVVYIDMAIDTIWRFMPVQL